MQKMTAGPLHRSLPSRCALQVTLALRKRRGLYPDMRPAGVTRMLTRRHLIALLAAQFALGRLIGEAIAQAPKAVYPTKPVRIIVPVAAGGPTDIVARMLADRLSAMWAQQVFIENRPGAGNNLGSEYVARSDPDGYTVLFDPGAIAANSSLYRKLSYDPIADFAPV